MSNNVATTDPSATSQPSVKPGWPSTVGRDGYYDAGQLEMPNAVAILSRSSGRARRDRPTVLRLAGDLTELAKVNPEDYASLLAEVPRNGNELLLYIDVSQTPDGSIPLAWQTLHPMIRGIAAQQQTASAI